MAIYRVGRASMDAQGYVTGTGGTKWREQLTLIRSGATIVFLTSPSAYATISEVIADDRMRVVSSSGKVVPESDYVILLHDSLTVDGLAQDVAETLRYYQGKETQFEAFIEFLKGFDFAKLEQLTTETRANAAAAADSQKKAQQNETNTAQYKDQALAAAQGAEQNKTLAGQYKDRAVQAETAANQAKDAAAVSQAAAKAEADRAAQITGIETVYDAIGNASIPLPDVWIPFNNSLQMITGYGEEIKVGGVTVANLVSYSRATTATYIDKSGNLKTASINEPRFEHEGILLENASTNIWINQTTDNMETINCVNIEELTPFGTMGTCVKLTPVPSQYSFIRSGVSNVSGKYTMSCFAKCVSDSESIPYVLCGTSGGFYVELTGKKLNNGWWRLEGLVDNPTGNTGFGWPIISASNGKAKEIILFGMQLESGEIATSYIPTNGYQATRAVDKCSIKCLCNLLELQNDYTVGVTFDRKTPDFRIYEIGEGNSILGSGNSIYFRNNGVDYRCDMDLTKTTTVSISVKDNRNKSVCVNSVIVKGNYIDLSIKPTGGEILVLGNTRTFTNRAPTGHIRDFKIWHHALTDEQLKAIK